MDQRKFESTEGFQLLGPQRPRGAQEDQPQGKTGQVQLNLGLKLLFFLMGKLFIFKLQLVKKT